FLTVQVGDNLRAIVRYGIMMPVGIVFDFFSRNLLRFGFSVYGGRKTAGSDTYAVNGMLMDNGRRRVLRIFFCHECYRDLIKAVEVIAVVYADSAALFIVEAYCSSCVCFLKARFISADDSHVLA